MAILAAIRTGTFRAADVLESKGGLHKQEREGARYLVILYVRSPAAFLDDSIFSPPLLPRMLTKLGFGFAARQWLDRFPDSGDGLLAVRKLADLGVTTCARSALFSVESVAFG